jgi:hypothetical protein
VNALPPHFREDIGHITGESNSVSADVRRKRMPVCLSGIGA